MTFAHFEWTRTPFRSTTDTTLYCPLAAHEQALRQLHRAFQHQEALASLVGPPGSGKTLLGLHFLEQLPDTIQKLLLHAPYQANPSDILQGLLFDLEQPYHQRSEQELRLAVRDKLLEVLEAQQQIALVIDEAQNLSREACEELRLLGNLESRRGKAIFIVLLGQDTWLKQLQQPEFCAFGQRLAIQAHLERLNREESLRYLRHQIRECGGKPEWIISDEALDMVAEFGKGSPRLLNRLASTSFELAETHSVGSVDVEIVMDAVEQLGLRPTLESQPTISRISDAKPEVLNAESHFTDDSQIIPHPGQVPRPMLERPTKSGMKMPDKRRSA